MHTANKRKAFVVFALLIVLLTCLRFGNYQMTMLDKRSKLRSTEVEAISKMIVKRFYFSDPLTHHYLTTGHQLRYAPIKELIIQMGDWET